MYIGKTPFAFLLTLVLLAVSHVGQSAQIEAISQHSIDLNRRTYNRLQLERSQDRAINEEQIRKIVSAEVMRAMSSNSKINSL